ncbi:MAG: Small, acid-soluble spore protein alpha [Firmicutes bacterium]|nr:Small, acid-soluble spore protein alpha [candidate division NPL-UPA2 bacterium]MBT9153421.1 Small, acid-soluble spore protein alpha [candidate division NPL-UPA2 bacterium]MBT9156987.1 Small, acid-soluble spore protein alpha [candidate division NPL-UPA2 bacterium]
MARGSDNTSNQIVVPQAKNAMEQFKYEVASELGIQTPNDGYWGTMTTRDTGAIGGHMVRKMIEMAERSLAGRGGTLR